MGHPCKYAEWDEPVTEVHVLHDSTLMKCPSKQKADCLSLGEGGKVGEQGFFWGGQMV